MAVIPVQAGSLYYYRGEGISVPHAFTTRLGGVSQGALSSLNIGVRRGDDPENVLENYRRLGEALGFDPHKAVLTRQTHTDIVRVVGQAQHGAGLYEADLPACDALVTNTPDTALVVFTADCTPVLLYDPVTGAVGAAHAGWRGTAAAIAEKTVEAMVSAFGCRREDLRAAIGPNIGPCCFETDGDVPQAMLQTYGTDAQASIRQQGEKYYVNLKELNALSLRRAGVKHIEVSGECTACRPALFWSARRVGANRGAQGGIIVCKEVNR